MRAAEPSPIIVWFRRDLRLADNPALSAAAASGAPVIPLFVLDERGAERPLGGAARWWLDKSLAALAADLAGLGAQLVLRRGEAGAEVARLAAETGARGVYWNRLYDPETVTRDTALKARLIADGREVKSFNASLLVEPWRPTTGAGGPFKVFTPFWRAARGLIDLEMAAAPSALDAPGAWPASEALTDWRLHPTAPDWSVGFDMWTPGEEGARAALEAFLDQNLRGYGDRRDLPARDATSHLSPHLHWGEIGPRPIMRAVETQVHAHEGLGGDAGKFLSELGWREFNHHVLFHNPRLATDNYRSSFDAFPWREDAAGFRAWSRGLTGYPLVDAGMRELWTTGYMHNRVRMVVSSFLVKHLLIDWRVGEAWFWDTLVDADLANNAANWQWVAGSGADAAPYFRIFNPIAQGEKFDPDGAYIRRWVPELHGLSKADLHQPWRAARPPIDYPPPIVDHAFARARALAAYAAVKGPSKEIDDD